MCRAASLKAAAASCAAAAATGAGAGAAPTAAGSMSATAGGQRGTSRFASSDFFHQRFGSIVEIRLEICFEGNDCLDASSSLRREKNASRFASAEACRRKPWRRKCRGLLTQLVAKYTISVDILAFTFAFRLGEPYHQPEIPVKCATLCVGTPGFVDKLCQPLRLFSQKGLRSAGAPSCYGKWGLPGRGSIKSAT